MKKLNQKGFSHFEIALLILVVALIGFAGYTVYQRNNKDQTVTPQTVVTKKDDTKQEETTPATNISATPTNQVVAGQIDFNIDGRRGDANTMHIDGYIMSDDLREVWAEYGTNFDKLDKQTEHITKEVGLGEAGKYGNFTFTIQANTLSTGTEYFYRIAAKKSDGNTYYSGIAAFTSRK